VTCTDRGELLSAFIDGELASAEVAELTKHLMTCPACLQRLAELGALRSALAETFAEEKLSEEFLFRITKQLDSAEDQLTTNSAAQSRVLPFKKRYLTQNLRIITSSVVMSAIAATLVLTLANQPKNIVDLAAVHDARLRNSLVSYEIQGASPAEISGYRIASTRYDIVAGHKAQIVSYEGASDIVTLCSWDAHGEPAHGVKTATYRGTAIMYWNDGTTEYWAASDKSDGRLADFVKRARKDAI
jgi:anti-sigma factor RsiW